MRVAYYPLRVSRLTIAPISGLRDAGVGKSFRHCALRSIDSSCLGNAGISSAMAPVQAGGAATGAPTRVGRRSSRRLRLRLSPSQSGYRRAGCGRGDRPVGLALSRLRRARHAGPSGARGHGARAREHDCLPPGLSRADRHCASACWFFAAGVVALLVHRLFPRPVRVQERSAVRAPGVVIRYRAIRECKSPTPMHKSSHPFVEWFCVSRARTLISWRRPGAVAHDSGPVRSRCDKAVRGDDDV